MTIAVEPCYHFPTEDGPIEMPTSLAYLLDKRNARPLVFGADAEALAGEIASLTQETVHLLDFRNRARPSWAERMTEACAQGGIVLLALDTSPDAHWFASNLEDLVRRQGWARDLELGKIFLVVCTSASLLDKIEGYERLSDLFQEQFAFVFRRESSSP